MFLSFLCFLSCKKLWKCTSIFVQNLIFSGIQKWISLYLSALFGFILNVFHMGLVFSTLYGLSDLIIGNMAENKND